MRCSTTQHPCYCGSDLPARSLALCLVSQHGDILGHRTMQAAPDPFLKPIAPYRQGLVVAVEGLFPWAWLAALGADQGLPVVWGPALYLKASHGGQATNDRIDAPKIAALRRGGMRPKASVYSAEMRATRALLRRRTPRRRNRSERFSPVHLDTQAMSLHRACGPLLCPASGPAQARRGPGSLSRAR